MLVIRQFQIPTLKTKLQIDETAVTEKRSGKEEDNKGTNIGEHVNCPRMKSQPRL